MDVEEKSETLLGDIKFSPLSEAERRAEIDVRIGAKLMEKELLRSEYVRGIFDCFTVVAFIAALVYMTFFFGGDK